MDIWSKEKRSEVMSKIRSKDTKPEKLLRSELHRLGFRFRIHRKDLSGKPDIVLPKYKTAIFVHGCFWHYHKECKEGRIPNTNSNFWKTKLEKNIFRDERNMTSLQAAGWKVLVVWECDLEKRMGETIDTILKYLNSL